MKLKSKVTLITGGSSGIGKAVVMALAKEDFENSGKEQLIERMIMPEEIAAMVVAIGQARLWWLTAA